jgi:hypothetical protein
MKASGGRMSASTDERSAEESLRIRRIPAFAGMTDGYWASENCVSERERRRDQSEPGRVGPVVSGRHAPAPKERCAASSLTIN